VVGGPCVGKTSCIQMLLRTLGAASDDNDDGGGSGGGGSSVHRELRLNPMSMTVDQLLGRFDEATSDWADGVFPVLLRRANRMTRGLSCAVHLQCRVCAAVSSLSRTRTNRLRRLDSVLVRVNLLLNLNLNEN